jgi:hypothetical protein
MKNSTKSSGKILSNFKAQVLKFSIILVFYQKDELQMVQTMQHFYKKNFFKKIDLDSISAGLSHREILDLLECPVCLQTPVADLSIFQCANGHIICR